MTWPPPPAPVGQVTTRDDESDARFDFHARPGVDGVILAVPGTRRVRIPHRNGDHGGQALRTAVPGTGPAEPADPLDRPRTPPA